MDDRDRIRVIVLDLDGTIYQDTTFHNHYIRYLVQGTDKQAWQTELTQFAQEVFHGKRLTMNTFYRSAKILADVPEQYFSLLEQAAEPGLSYDDRPPAEDFINLGDAWSVVTLLGRTLGLLDAGRQDEIFIRTRQQMRREGLAPNHRLRDAIVRAGSCCTTVLLSNSYPETAMDFLRRLGCERAFDRMAFSVGKPHGLVEALNRQCPGALEQPQTVLAIGDHAYNDLEPLRRLGCRTVWINPLSGIHKPLYDICLKTTDDLAQYLDGICSNTPR